MPPLLLEVIPLSDSSLFEVRSGDTSGDQRRFSLTEDKVRHGSEFFDKKGVKFHMTPLYATSDRERLPLSVVPPFIGHIPLRLEKGAKSTTFWVKRGTALVCLNEQ